MGLGYCDFDGSQAICDGDMQFCEKPDALKKYLLEQNNNGKVLGEGKNSFQRIRNYEYGENDRFLGPSYPDK